MQHYIIVKYMCICANAICLLQFNVLRINIRHAFRHGGKALTTLFPVSPQPFDVRHAAGDTKRFHASPQMETKLCAMSFSETT